MFTTLKKMKKTMPPGILTGKLSTIYKQLPG